MKSTWLGTALLKLDRVKPPGGHKGGIVMDIPEEEEVASYHGKGNNGFRPGGAVMEDVPEEEPDHPLQQTLLGKLAYQVCEDDIQRLKANQAVSMVSQNILAQSLGSNFVGNNQAALVKQTKARR